LQLQLAELVAKLSHRLLLPSLLLNLLKVYTIAHDVSELATCMTRWRRFRLSLLERLTPVNAPSISNSLTVQITVFSFVLSTHQQHMAFATTVLAC
jgi:hypothetical protein